MSWIARGSAVLVLLAGLVFVPVSPVMAADNWVKVADRGLRQLSSVEDPARTIASQLTVYRDRVYVASNEKGSARPWIFRAPLVNDSAWDVKNPAWGNAGEVTDLVAFGTDLYASTTRGGVWRLGPADTWAQVPAPDSATAIHAMAVSSVSGVAALCVAHAIMTISCSSAPGTSPWTSLPAHPTLANDARIGSIRLRHYSNELYVGIGGSRAGTRHCEVWSSRPGGTWRALTTNCFGRPGLTWLLSMQEFDGWLYMGTGGHGRGLIPVLMRTRTSPLAIEVQDVTPYGLYTCEGETVLCPLRYQSMTATRSALYVGTRTNSPPVDSMGGDVLARDVQGAWRRSNDAGFGESNDEITSMTSDGSRVYAGTLNLLNDAGFQVWRRSATFLERFPNVIIPRLDPVFRICGQLCDAITRNICIVIVSPCNRFES